jgi:osmoprotectant transport system ATP-binding protein
VNADKQPQGWVRAGGGGKVTEDSLWRGGTLATQGGTLREALDACLSSPSGRGVVVAEDGRLLGSLTAREVLDLIEAKAAPA